MKTTDSSDFIEANAGTMTTEDIAQKLGKSPNAVRCIAKRRGISLVVEDLSYTYCEDLFIVKHIHKLSYEDMATKMSKRFQIRSKDSIRQRASWLGVAGVWNRKEMVLTKAPSSRHGQPWTVFEDAYIVLVHNRILHYNQAAKHTGRTAESVTYRAKQLSRESKAYAISRVIADELLVDPQGN